MGAIAGHNPTDRSKLGQAKRYFLTDKNDILLSVVITLVSIHDIKAVTDVIDKSVIKQPFVSNTPKEVMRRRWKYQNLCIDRAYSSKTISSS